MKTTLHSTRAVFAILLIVHVAHAEVPGVDEADYPASIAELAPEPIPAEQNAAVHLERIAPDLEAFGKAYGAYINSPEGDSFENRIAKGKPPTAEQLASVRKILDDHAVIFEALEKAAACDAYASQLDFTGSASELWEQVLERTQRVRILARGVDWKITLLLADGKRDDAVRLGTQLLRVNRLRENEPLLINYLVSTAVHGMSIDALNTAIRSGPIDPEVRADLLDELAAQEGPSLQKVLRSERAFAQHHSWERIQQTRGDAGEIAPELLQLQVAELSAIDEARDAADKPWHVIRAQWGPNGPELAMPLTLESTRILEVRCLRILIALIAFHERTGKDATGIEQLGLPKEVIVDPFSGDPLKLISTREGWVIYSVMQNEADEAGNFKNRQDYGLAPPGYPTE